MELAEAINSRVSVARAIAEIKAHGYLAEIRGQYLFADNCRVARIVDGVVSGKVVLVWLGY